MADMVKLFLEDLYPFQYVRFMLTDHCEDIIDIFGDWHMIRESISLTVRMDTAQERRRGFWAKC